MKHKNRPGGAKLTQAEPKKRRQHEELSLLYHSTHICQGSKIINSSGTTTLLKINVHKPLNERDEPT